METTVKRQIFNAIIEYKSKYPILAVTGPRQSGKTTFLKASFPDYRYVSLENPDHRDFALNDPNGFLKEYDRNIIFDEVQQAPKLFSYLQTLVDSRPTEMGAFILSGSQNFHLMERITQSLAGRVAIFKLLPFDFNELSEASLMDEDPFDQAIHGFYPAIYHRKISSTAFYSNYLETYVNRDITELISVRDTRQFKNFLSLCATRAGQLLNLNGLANECGISQPTAKSWLSALESSYLTFQLYPFHRNFSKRIIKTPKLYFYDTGLLCHLLKIKTRENLIANSVKGAIFENLIISEFQKQNYHRNLFQSPWFWRDSHGLEIDLLLDKGDSLDLFEIKAGETVLTEHFDHMSKFASIADLKIQNSYLVNAGSIDQVRSKGKVVSWKSFPSVF